MNKFKKIGLSALAGSLAAVSAHAGEVAVTGSLTATYASKDGIQAGDGGKGFSTDTGITFTASTELDNGFAVSGFITQLEGFTAISSSQMTVDMGSLGKLKVNRVGGGAVNALDDKLPTAWEEASDNINHDFIGENIGAGNDDGAISYHLPELSVDGIGSINIGLDYDPAANVSAGGTGSTQIAAAGGGGTGTGMAVQIATDLGLNIYAGVDTIENQDAVGTVGAIVKDEFNGTAGANYAYGPVTVGYQTWYNDPGKGVHYESEGMSVAFAVNENLSVSYATIEETKFAAGVRSANTDIEADLKSYNVAYSMGSIAIKAHRTESGNPDFTDATDGQMTEVSVSFAF